MDIVPYTPRYVYVVSYDPTVDAGPDAGGGGFEWFRNQADAIQYLIHQQLDSTQQYVAYYDFGLVKIRINASKTDAEITDFLQRNSHLINFQKQLDLTRP